MRLIAVGDNVTDSYVEQGVYYPGGQAVNVAANAAQDGAEAAAYLGVFGDDARADHIRVSLAEEGVSLVRCRKAYAATAAPGVRILDGDRVFMRGPRDSVAHLLKLRICKEDLQYFGGFDVCHTTNESGTEDDLAAIHGVTAVSFDFSTERDEAYLAKVAPNVNIAFCSGDGLSQTDCEAFARHLQTLGPQMVIITMGGRGSVCIADGTLYRQSIREVNAVDSMGAGDSFAAALLVRYFDTHDVDAALAFAAERAAHTCTVHGAFGHPHADDGVWGKR